MNDNQPDHMDNLGEDPLIPVEPVSRPEPEPFFKPDADGIAPLPEAIDAELAQAEEDGEPVERLTDEELPPAKPPRRSSFQVLGVALVWYYVYTLIKSLVDNEVEPSQRGLLTGFIVIMAVVNTFLTIQLIRTQWKLYQERKNTSDT